jgi:hypothetical protein
LEISFMETYVFNSLAFLNLVTFVANIFPYIFQIHDNAMWGNQTLGKFPSPCSTWPTYIIQ